MRRDPLLLFVAGGVALLLAACSSNDPSPSGGTGGTAGSGGAGGGTGGGGDTPGGCTTPTEVPCSDQVILQMNLQSDVTKGLISNAPDGAGFTSSIDATAGGAFTADPESYTYAQFKETGLVKVDISDEASLDSMGWDIAFRRYVVRINSGNSGPSCVQAARVPGSAKYDDVTEPPADLTFKTDDYFTDSCDLIPDGSGLPSSPATALSSYWTYPGCVQMTDHVFIVQLGDGRVVKLAVVDYYTPSVQDQCDATGMIPMANTGSGNFHVRWAYLK